MTKPSTWCGQSGLNQNKYRWIEKIPIDKLNQLLNALSIGRIQGLKALRRGVSGRITLLEIRGSQGRSAIEGEYNIRKTLGGLRSAMFIITETRTNRGDLLAITLHGGGWGHGVGMCQTGAMGMAKSGISFRSILMHYYNSSELVPLY